MTSMRKKARLAALTVLSLLVLGGVGAFAQRQLSMAQRGRPEVRVGLTGAVERDGARVPVERVSSVKPGEVIDWTITSENQGNAAAHEYKATGHIPRGTQLIAGSATSDGSASVSYSIDDGKTFSPQPTIEERQADGTTKRVPAPVSMYTQIRYEWADSLAQNSKLNASYQVRVK